MDRLNLENLALISRAICEAADHRHDSRGAHFREDFPEAGDLATSRYTQVKLDGGRIVVGTEAVKFTHVKPGDTLLKQTAAE
jgi:fumarate reductase flavoprotein subunit